MAPGGNLRNYFFEGQESWRGRRRKGERERREGGKEGKEYKGAAKAGLIPS